MGNQNIIACQKQSALVTVLIWMNLIANFPLYASSGAFERFRKVTVSFLMSVCLSNRLTAWDNSAPNGRIFVKFDSCRFFENLSNELKFY